MSTRTIGQMYQGSFVITEAATAVESLPPATTLVFRPSIQNRVEALIRQMKVSGLFSSRVVVWERAFKDRFTDVVTPEARFAAAKALAFLLFNEIRPISCAPWENEVLSILTEVLPTEIPKERFLENFERFFRDEAVGRKKRQMLEKWFQEELQMIHEYASRTDDSMERKCQEVAQQMVLLMDQVREGVIPLRQAVGALAQLVESLHSDLTKKAEEAESLVSRIGAQAQKLQEIVQQGTATIQRMKI